MWNETEGRFTETKRAAVYVSLKRVETNTVYIHHWIIGIVGLIECDISGDEELQHFGK